MPPVTDEQVVQLLPLLEEAARADPKLTPARFVPPRTGILEQAAARRHLFVFGRRGVGKSTLLRKIEQDHGWWVSLNLPALVWLCRVFAGCANASSPTGGSGS
jgi:hypothetical protein